MNKDLDNFPFVEASLHWTFNALTEISYLNKERKPNEIKLVNGPPFEFYRISLHYMFTMEFMKLMENNNDRFPDNHHASLEKLSIAVYNKKGETFKKHHEENLEIFSLIKNSNFYLKLKEDRDKKFAHSDANQTNPFSFHSFSDEEIKEAFDHLNSFNIIMDNCTGVFGFSFVFQHPDTRTDNFIKFHTNYKEYYHANYLDAMKKGYH